MIPVPPLTTERLLIRPLHMGDLEDVYHLLDAPHGGLAADLDRWEQRAAWLEWTVLGYEQLAALHQPPYGERAVTLRNSGELVGLAGYVPAYGAFPRLPSLAPAGGPLLDLNSAELGLFFHVAPAHRRRGLAAEAARALVDFAFSRLNAWRIVATTTRDNTASMAVMRRLGMAILENPYPEPEYLQVVGVRYNPAMLQNSASPP